ncbi:SRPBCC family protein [Phenylobacterium sp.]|uniref:SRPBCC family protein n=1 Tax=Phenylobacterium sp. TaxID=1871053 RepID=UPI0011F9C86D|nr:SRPBCC family protein [Phenylobacterium sp.]THD72491.1 MAG: ATPase [Phenylobacterium sp.]
MSQTIKPAAIAKTFAVGATPERAFKVFTAGFGGWWPKTHYVGDSPLTGAVIEPRAGGRWYGEHEDGVERLWGDVLVWDPPGHLVLAWRLNAEFAYDPALLTEVDVHFTAVGDAETRIDFEHRGLERFGDSEAAKKTLTSMDGGWSLILDSFKAVADA